MSVAGRVGSFWLRVPARARAVLGAIVVNSAKSGLSESFPAIWQYFLGALFIGAVLLFPGGIMGLFRGEGWRWSRWLRAGQARTALREIIAGVRR